MEFYHELGRRLPGYHKTYVVALVFNIALKYCGISH